MPLIDRSPLHETHAASGAVFAERGAVPLVSSYGDPAAEYDAALDGAALVDLAERGVLAVSGPKRQAFLHGMVSNDVEGRGPGQGCRAALMTAKGRLRFLLRVLVEEDVVRVETDADRLPQLLKDLELYRVAAPVRFALEPAAILGLLGMRAAEILKDQGIEPPGSPEDHRRAPLAGREVLVARAGDLPGGGFVVHTPPGARRGGLDGPEGRRGPAGGP